MSDGFAGSSVNWDDSVEHDVEDDRPVEVEEQLGEKDEGKTDVDVVSKRKNRGQKKDGGHDEAQATDHLLI